MEDGAVGPGCQVPLTVGGRDRDEAGPRGLLAADLLLAAGERPMRAWHRPAWAGSATRAARGRGSARGYLLLTYFSRRICATPSPACLSASKQASTMFGLPHR